MNIINFLIRAAVIIVLMFFAILLIGAGGPRENVFKFDHGLHVIENEIACTDCHLGMTEKSAGKRAIPDHDVCSDCHDPDGDDDCGMCHINGDDPEAVPKIDEKYEVFAHNVHLSKNIECIECHGDILALGDSPLIPDMKECRDCHEQANGPLECNICHLGEIPEPDTHQAMRWQHDHGIEALSGTDDCRSCHEQNTCDECHQGDNIYGKPHPPTWLFNHFAESAFGGECMVCHETREFCSDCHKVMQSIPHPLGTSWAFDDKNNPGDHADEAKSFIEGCISCHDIGESDPTCSMCHAE